MTDFLKGWLAGCVTTGALVVATVLVLERLAR